MRTKTIIVACMVIVIGGGVGWCKLAYPTYTYRYRMTVEVMADGVLHSGSSVIEVTLQKQPVIIWGVIPVLPSVRGEAVFVDLGQGRNVIGLLATGPYGQNVGYPAGLVSALFGLRLDDVDLPIYPALHGRRELPENLLPTFVTFADLNDPKTARAVSANDFERVFGKGVRLEHVWLAMTTDPVTTQIDTKLPWWKRRGRPADEAYQTWIRGRAGPAIEPETLFKRG